MNFGNLPIVGLMRNKLSYLSARQTLLAHNIANADTPGYKAQDLQKPDFGSELAKAGNRLGMTATSARHFNPQMQASAFQTVKRPETYETTPTQNNVAIEEETMLMAQGQMDYQTVTNLYRKTIEIFRAAIGSRG